MRRSVKTVLPNAMQAITLILAICLPVFLLCGHVEARNPVDKYVNDFAQLQLLSRTPRLEDRCYLVTLDHIRTPHSMTINLSTTVGVVAAITGVAGPVERSPSRAPILGSSFR